MESVAQKMAELPIDAPETPFLWHPWPKKNLIICWDRPYELSMQNLESVTQKMAELLLN